MGFFLPLAMAGGSMLASHLQNESTGKRNAAMGAAAAEQTRYSPWTGMGAGQHTPEAEQSVVGAGLQGALLGASFQNGMGNAAPTGDAGSNMAMNTATPQATSAIQSGGAMNPYNASQSIQGGMGAMSNPYQRSMTNFS